MQRGNRNSRGKKEGNFHLLKLNVQNNKRGIKMKIEIYKHGTVDVREEFQKIEGISVKIFRFANEKARGLIIPKQKSLEKLFTSIEKLPRSSREEQSKMIIFSTIVEKLPKLGNQFDMMGFYWYKGNLVIEDTFCGEGKTLFGDSLKRLRILVKGSRKNYRQINKRGNLN